MLVIQDFFDATLQFMLDASFRLESDIKTSAERDEQDRKILKILSSCQKIHVRFLIETKLRVSGSGRKSHCASAPAGS
jgi:hypothetical protein